MRGSPAQQHKKVEETHPCNTAKYDLKEKSITTQRNTEIVRRGNTAQNRTAKKGTTVLQHIEMRNIDISNIAKHNGKENKATQHSTTQRGKENTVWHSTIRRSEGGRGRASLPPPDNNTHKFSKGVTGTEN